MVWKDMTKLKIQFPFTTWTGRKSSVCNYILIIHNLSVSFMAVKSIQRRVLRWEEKEDMSN